MKMRFAKKKALTKARPVSGKIVHALRAQLAGSELSPQCEDNSRDEIVVSAIRQFPDRKIVQTMSAQLAVSNFEEIVAAMRRQSESGFLSLAPGFSQVSRADRMEKPFQRFLRASNKPLKRFAYHAAVNTRLKPGANERPRRGMEVPRDLCGTTALTPALSPRRERIVRRWSESREAGIARSALGKDRVADRCSLSPGERARVRASVETNLGFCN
jgi:hypothetical protein